MERKYENLRKPATTEKEAVQRLYDVVSILRKECPWDKAQTHESLIKGMIEEAYEAVEAIKNNDMENLNEELGDVLLQVVLHSIIAEETDEFSFISVVNDECEKMIRRHPHIFAEEDIKSVDKVLEKWENIKGAEQGDKTQTLILESVPKALPALIRSYKVQKKAADVGFDWDDVSGAFSKIKEETEELLEVSAGMQQERIAEEVGDLLFSVVNAARFLDVDPEQALTKTTDKFVRRFSHIEKRASELGRTLSDMSLEEMDRLWDEAKELERKTK
ncbi:MAG: nucleoside triphosphate pyrophosphohydrolase [Clostridiales bacterium]|nr:nucleoside triphosphate pyrophosphohydrolase [Clostridiales bacterium]